VAGSEAPSEHAEHGDRRDRDQDEGEPWSPATADPCWRTRAQLQELGLRKPQGELVDEALPVDAEKVGGETKEALRVGPGRKELEALLLQRRKVPLPDPCFPLDLGPLKSLALARYTEGAADLEHAAPGLLGKRVTIMPERSARRRSDRWRECSAHRADAETGASSRPDGAVTPVTPSTATLK
jgi:hypothetical protein